MKDRVGDEKLIISVAVRGINDHKILQLNALHRQHSCHHTLADGNQRIRIREKTLEFSSTVLSTVSSGMSALRTRVKSR